MKVSVGVEKGSNKTECEDTAFLNELLISSQFMTGEKDDLQCVGVADGVGGNAGGRIASRYVTYRLARTSFSHMNEDGIRQLIKNINEEIVSQAAEIPGMEAMATTLTCIVAANQVYYLIHAGNTRLYIMQGSYLKQITSDHTTSNWLISCGQYEAAQQCNINEINCCIGGGNTDYASQLVVEKIFDNDFPCLLIFTSDGVHDFADLDFIEDALNTSDSDGEAIRRIINRAVQNGSTDDKSIIVVRK
jgi:protein phosphatase